MQGQGLKPAETWSALKSISIPAISHTETERLIGNFRYRATIGENHVTTQIRVR